MELRSFVLYYFPLVIGALATMGAALYVYRLRRHLRLEEERHKQKFSLGG